MIDTAAPPRVPASASAKRRTVLHVIPTLEMGGAPKYLVELCGRQSAGTTVAPHVLVLGSEENTFADPDCLSLRHLGRTVRWSRPWEASEIASVVWRVAKSVGAEILHTHLPPADFVGAMAAGGSLPHVAHLQGTPPWLAAGGLRTAARRWLTRRAFRRSDAEFACVSTSVKRHYVEHLGLPGDRCTVLPNTVDPRGFLDLSPAAPIGGPLRLLAGGRMVAEKGFDVLIEAVGLLARRGVDAHLTLAGEGGQLRSLKSRAESAGLANRVRFPGPLRDMAAEFSRHEVFVLPSRHSEGLPLILLEAMASARLIVATDTAGVRDAIVDGESGFIAPGLGVEALASVISRAVADPSAASGAGAAARRRFEERFRPEVADAALERIYSTAVRRGALR